MISVRSLMAGDRLRAKAYMVMNPTTNNNKLGCFSLGVAVSSASTLMQILIDEKRDDLAGFRHDMGRIGYNSVL